MSERILVAVDGSAPSDTALSWAVERARNTSGTIQLLHVIEDTLVALAPSLVAQLEDNARSLLEQQYRRTRELAPDLSVTTSLAAGSVLSTLKTASNDADLLVIGTHRHGLVLGEILGTFSLRAAAAVSCSLAVIPELPPAGHGVVVGVSQSSTSLITCDFAAAEAAAHDEDLLIICAGYVTNPLLADLMPPSVASLDRESAIATAAAHVQVTHPAVDVHTHVVYGAPADALIEASKDSRLLVLGKRRLYGAQRFGRRPIGHDVLLGASVPVVLVQSGTPVEEDPLERDGAPSHE